MVLSIKLLSVHRKHKLCTPTMWDKWSAASPQQAEMISRPASGFYITPMANWDNYADFPLQLHKEDSLAMAEIHN